MKRFLSIVLSGAMALSLAACGAPAKQGEVTANPTKEPAEVQFTPGTYTATSTGHGGNVTLEVKVDESTIVSVDAVEFSETGGIGEVALQAVVTSAVEGQTLNIDTVTGCTVSFAAVMTALKDALTQAGGDVTVLSAREQLAKEAVPAELSADVVVVGSGVAGMCAAIEAAEAGASVIVIEKLDRTGGSSLTSSAMVLGSNTPQQQEAGIVDTDDGLLNYWIERSANDKVNTVDVEFLKFVAERANKNLAWMTGLGIGYTKDIVIVSGTTATRRAHCPPAYGVDMMDKLNKKAAEMGVKTYTSTKAEYLVQAADGAVTGVKAINNGAETQLSAKAVVLATGGFGWNNDMLKEYSPTAEGAWSMSAPGCTGDGINMGIAVGADTVFKGGVIGWKVVTPKYDHTTIVGLPLYGALNLIVDSKGDRIGNESNDYPFIYLDMAANGDDTFYAVFDSAAGDTVTLETTQATIANLELGVEAGVVFKADSLEDLAQISGLTNLPAAAQELNTAVETGTADKYGRPAELITPVVQGPFYAIRCQKATLGTFGGLKIKFTGEVLNTQGEAIPGLYAAGETANGDFFNDVYYASGSAITFSVATGREAGASAAAFAKD